MASIAAIGMIGGGACGESSPTWLRKQNVAGRKMNSSSRMFCLSSSSSSVMDPYQTLRIQPEASESEVKKAFRKLALQYHPDVCRGSNCGVQFSMINEAYDMVIKNLREEPSDDEYGSYNYGPSDQGIDEPLRGMDDEDYDMWEEWMGWEGAGIRDYTSHINPYI